MDSFNEIARRVFVYWKEVTTHPKSCLDEKRLRLLIARVRDGYSEEDLKLAAFGCVSSRWHQGENDAQRIYDSVELIYRGADKVDQFMRMGDEEIGRRVKEEARQKMLVESERLSPRSEGNSGYEAAKAKLLSVVKLKRVV